MNRLLFVVAFDLSGYIFQIHDFEILTLPIFEFESELSRSYHIWKHISAYTGRTSNVTTEHYHYFNDIELYMNAEHMQI